MWAAYAVTFAVAFGISFALSPLCAKLGMRSGVADRPGGRRRHGRVISRLGGIALCLGFVGAVVVSQLLSVPRLDPNEPRRLLGLLAGCIVPALHGAQAKVARHSHQLAFSHQVDGRHTPVVRAKGSF